MPAPPSQKAVGTWGPRLAPTAPVLPQRGARSALRHTGLAPGLFVPQAERRQGVREGPGEQPEPPTPPTPGAAWLSPSASPPRGNSKYHYYGLRIKASSPLLRLMEDQQHMAMRGQPFSQKQR